jgi:hypothetical protein
MKMTQSDYAERAQRIDDGTATDDDRRLVELYEREGFSRDGEGAVSRLTARVDAEVVKGDESDQSDGQDGEDIHDATAEAKPVKATRGRRGNGTEGNTR